METSAGSLFTQRSSDCNVSCLLAALVEKCGRQVVADCSALKSQSTWLSPGLLPLVKTVVSINSRLYPQRSCVTTDHSGSLQCEHVSGHRQRGSDARADRELKQQPLDFVRVPTRKSGVSAWAPRTGALSPSHLHLPIHPECRGTPPHPEPTAFCLRLCSAATLSPNLASAPPSLSAHSSHPPSQVTLRLAWFFRGLVITAQCKAV